MTKRYVQQLEKEVNEGKTERAKRAKKNAKKTRKKITKKVDKISKKSVKPESLTNRTKKEPKNDIKKPLNEIQKQLIIKLSEAYGTKSITDICNELSISRDTYYRWIKEHPEILDAVGYGFDAKFEYLEFIMLEAAQAGEYKAAESLMKMMLSHPYMFARRRSMEAKLEWDKMNQAQAEQKEGITITVSGETIKHAIDLL